MILLTLWIAGVERKAGSYVKQGGVIGCGTEGSPVAHTYLVLVGDVGLDQKSSASFLNLPKTPGCERLRMKYN
jgi:hypothetical protein